MSERRVLRFAADVALLASVRDFAVDAARSLGASVGVDDLVVVVGELAANAAVHQDAEAELTIELLPTGGLLIEVVDDDGHLPSVVEHEAWSVDGHRGLFLVQALSEAWGVEASATGKRVWARLAPVASESPARPLTDA